MKHQKQRSSVYNIIMKPYISEIFIELYNNPCLYLTQLTKRIRGDVSYITKLVSKLEQMNYIKKNKKGRKQIIELTPKGKQIAKYFSEIKKAMKNE